MTYQYIATTDLQFFIMMQYDSALINIPMWSWNAPSLNEIKVAITDSPSLEGVNIKFLQKSVVITDLSQLFMDIP